MEYSMILCLDFTQKVKDVVIERCDISGWGRQDPCEFGTWFDSGIKSESLELKRIVVQRNLVMSRAPSDFSRERKNGERLRRPSVALCAMAGRLTTVDDSLRS